MREKLKDKKSILAIIVILVVMLIAIIVTLSNSKEESSQIILDEKDLKVVEEVILDGNGILMEEPSTTFDENTVFKMDTDLEKWLTDKAKRFYNSDDYESINEIKNLGATEEEFITEYVNNALDISTDTLYEEADTIEMATGTIYVYYTMTEEEKQAILDLHHKYVDGIEDNADD